MGNLYIVATPIGNLQDITLRAAKILLEIPVIVAESTSKTGILLDFLEKEFKHKRIDGQKIISMTEDEEESKISRVIQTIRDNDVALISEAGTPLISDPGYRLVNSAIKMGFRIIPIPGPSAVIAALSASGLPTDKFKFIGFLPKSQNKRAAVLENGKNQKCTLIIYESPHRIVETLKTIVAVFGNIDLVIARELTKIHEEIIRDKAENIIKQFEKKYPKGELIILV